jgi:hypothetical protein
VRVSLGPDWWAGWLGFDHIVYPYFPKNINKYIFKYL